MPLSPFKENVINIIRNIPYGQVMSYGQVAIYVGVPRAARQVGWTLARLEETISLPWWRVLNNAGRITIKGNRYNTPEIQMKLLEGEGVQVNRNLTLDITQYRYILSPHEIQQLELNDEYIMMLLDKIPFASPHRR